MGFAVFDPLYMNDATYSYAWYIAILAGIAAAAIVGIVMQVAFLGWMQGQELRQALVTIGISIIVADQLLEISGGSPSSFFAPDILFGADGNPLNRPLLPPSVMSSRRAVAVGVGLWLLINKTRLGTMVRAGVDDRQMQCAGGWEVEGGGKRDGGLRHQRAPHRGVRVRARCGAGRLRRRHRRHGPADAARHRRESSLLTSLVVVIVGRAWAPFQAPAIGAILIGVTEQWGTGAASDLFRDPDLRHHGRRACRASPGNHGEVRLMQMLSRMQWAISLCCACLPPEPALPAAGPSGRANILGRAIVYGIVAMSLTFLASYGGFVSLAQTMIAGIAGYTVAVLAPTAIPARQSLAALLGADPACRGRRNAGGRNRRADRRADPRDLPVDDHAGAGCRLQPVRPIQHRWFNG